jgi:transposase
LTPQEDARLREIEQDAHLKPKVRLRAQVLRLSGRGEGVGSVASYTARSESSILRDFALWEQRGFEGLADGTAPGNPSRVSAEVRAFVQERLSEERTWNASQLAEQIRGRFGVVVGAEAVRQRLLSMGYRWKRTRYVPSKPADPEEEREAREELEGLKGGLRGASWS